MQPHFEVDRKGLAKLLARRGKEFIITELLQNAWDEAGVTLVEVNFHQADGEATLQVIDDSPEGFADLTHAYTLFAESKKKGNVKQRGRFNIGEKLVIAVSDHVTIQTTMGTVLFTPKGRMHSKDKRPHGTQVFLKLKMNKDEAAALRTLALACIPPDGIDTRFNNISLIHRAPAATLRATLPTEIADDEGYLRASARQTDLKLYTVTEGEKATLYEMGIPVVEFGDGIPWHVDVAQKVPLNSDRDNVTPSYMQKVRVAVLNHMAGEVTAEQATAPWVATAIEDKNIEVAAVKATIVARYGDKVVINDPSDQEGTKMAVSAGYTVIPSRAFSKEAWANVKAAGVLPAGQVTPSPKVYSENGRPENVLDESEWTPNMKETAAYARELARTLLGKDITVRIVKEPTVWWSANYGGGCLTLNFAGLKLSHEWFMHVGSADQLELFLHEFAHDRISDHLSRHFADEVARLAVKLTFHVADGQARLRQVADGPWRLEL